MNPAARFRVDGAWLAGLIYLIPLLFFLPHLDDFAYPPQAGAYSDLVITHDPNTYYIKQSLVEYREAPLWSPQIFSGYPFIADPLSGLVYPPGWIAWLLPLPAGLNILAILHILLGGIGMFKLLRAEGVEWFSAFYGGFVFTLLPKLTGHFAAGHLTLLYAISWTPWLLLSWRMSVGKVDSVVGGKNKTFLLPGFIYGLIFLADPRWALPSGLVWWGYALFHHQNIVRDVRSLTKQTGLALMVSAPLLIPLAEYMLLSTRQLMEVNDILELSLPPARLLGMIFPDFGGYYEWMLYPGAFGVGLVLVGIWGARESRSTQFWFGLMFLSLLVSLGAYVPGSQYLARLPGISLLRVPPRSLFLSGMAIAAITAWSLQATGSGIHSPWLERARLSLVTWIGFCVVFSLGILTLTNSVPAPFIWGTAGAVIVFIWFILGWIPKTERGRLNWKIGFVLLTLVDLFAIDRSLIVFKPAEKEYQQANQIAEWLRKQPGLFRVYSPSYSVPQQVAARNRLQLVDGIGPLQLESYAHYMENATGVPRTGYSVTQPPYANGDPEHDNQNFIPDARLLGFLNVGFVISAFPLQVDGLEEVARFDSVTVYKNGFRKPRAWVQTNSELTSDVVAPVKSLVWRPDEILVEATGPGVLVLSEVVYPGWEAEVDGKPARIDLTGGLLRGVQLTPGAHRVSFNFRPITFYSGLVLCALGLGLGFTRHWNG